MENLNIKKLNAKNKKLEDLRNNTYNQVKKECYNKIQAISNIGKMECWYIVPTILLGHPPINIDQCANYLKEQLKKEPVIFEFYQPNIFFISWDPKMQKV